MNKVEVDPKWYLKRRLDAGLLNHQDIEDIIGQATSHIETAQQKITALEESNKEMRGLLIELASETHRNKNLHKWYCENAEKYPEVK